MTEELAIDFNDIGWGLMCRRGVDAVLTAVDHVWKFAGARHGIQEIEEVGMGFEGWCWRNSVAY